METFDELFNCKQVNTARPANMLGVKKQRSDEETWLLGKDGTATLFTRARPNQTVNTGTVQAFQVVFAA
jgi:hypothetical protein